MTPWVGQSVHYVKGSEQCGAAIVTTLVAGAAVGLVVFDSSALWFAQAGYHPGHPGPGPDDLRAYPAGTWHHVHPEGANPE